MITLSHYFYLNVLLGHRSCKLVESCTEQDMLLLVFFAVVPWKVQRVTELLLLVVEMVSHQLMEIIHQTLVLKIVLNIQHGFEQALVLIIKLLILSKLL